jgi:hypothetical protein
MQSFELPVSTSGAPDCVKLAVDKAWFHIGPAEGLSPLCGIWHGKQTWSGPSVPNRRVRSCSVPLTAAEANADISATAKTAIGIVLVLIPIPLAE